MVAEYTKYYKIFGFMGGILGTVIQYPIWTAVSKAYVERKAGVIQKMHLYCLIFAAIFFIINIGIAVFLQDIFDIWLGAYTIVVQPHVVWIFIIYSAVFLFAQATIIICNAIEALKYLLIINIIGAIIKIPLTYLLHFFFSRSISWEVVILVNSIIYLPNVIIPFFEIRKKIRFGKDKNTLSDTQNMT
jgi:O-antigen/teichoic acid export membrane protein